MAAFKIVLADDHAIIREGLKSLLKSEKDFEVVGEASDGQELLDVLAGIQPDLVILDLHMPNMDGLTALKEIGIRHKNVQVLVLTMLKDYEHFKHCMALGACGYMLKEDAYAQLVLALRTILRDKVYVSPAMSHLLSEHFIRSIDEADMPALDLLTRREKEILRQVAKGQSNKQIAALLNISTRTVESHRMNFCNKLGLHTTAGLVKYAMAKGLVD